MGKGVDAIIPVLNKNDKTKHKAGTFLDLSDEWQKGANQTLQSRQKCESGVSQLQSAHLEQEFQAP